MKIAFPKITQVLDLSKYAPGIEGRVIVWVNPPRSLLNEYGDLIEKWRDANSEQEAMDAADGVYKIFSELLSQAEDKETHFSIEELKELTDSTQDTDPNFWIWLQDEIMRAVFEHRGFVKKR